MRNRCENCGELRRQVSVVERERAELARAIDQVLEAVRGLRSGTLRTGVKALVARELQKKLRGGHRAT